MVIHESAEDYLEAILMLKEQKGVVHSIDVAKELSVSKPSVSVAMKNLKENQYIEIEKSGEIILLPKGLKIAKTIYERHKFLTEWLIALGLKAKVAEDDACRIEHDISPETFNALKAYVSKTMDYYKSNH